MSYILDALRRADAEREREKGAVPGLHARPLTASAPEAAPPPPRQQGPWLALGVAIGLLAAGGWWVLGRSTPAPAPVAAAPIVQVVPVPVPVQVPAPAPAPAPMAAPAPAPLPAPAPAPATTARLPAGSAGSTGNGTDPARPPARPAAPGAERALPADPAPPAGGRVDARIEPRNDPRAEATPPPAAAPAPAPAPRPVQLAQLSPDLRREMPAMTMGGSVYSESPASRFVIINGQVVREGEGAAAGVTVERIGPKSAVLRWREMRIEVPL